MTTPSRTSSKILSGFVCAGCGRCCRWPGPVRISADETDAIAAFIGMEVTEFIDRHTALTRDRRGLTLLERPDGSCAWLTADNRCMLQKVKPRQCAGFPLEWNFPGWENECLGAKK